MSGFHTTTEIQTIWQPDTFGPFKWQTYPYIQMVTLCPFSLILILFYFSVHCVTWGETRFGSFAWDEWRTTGLIPFLIYFYFGVKENLGEGGKQCKRVLLGVFGYFFHSMPETCLFQGIRNLLSDLLKSILPSFNPK